MVRGVIKGRRAKTAFIAGLGLWSISAISIAQDETSYPPTDTGILEAAFRKLKQNDGLQFELPAPPPPPKIGWLETIGKFLADIFGALRPLFEIIFWIGLGAIIAGALYLIAQTIYSAVQASREKAVKAAPPPPPLYQPERKRARILLEEIDALAAAGKFEEAVHTLLHRSIQDIDANRPNVIRRSLTSREIGELSVLTEKAQTAFSEIAKVVEHAFFGGHLIGQSDFQKARDAYASLALGDSADNILARKAAA